MNDKIEVFNFIRELVSKDISKAIGHLNELSVSTEERDTIILLSGQLKDIDKDFEKGIIIQDNYYTFKQRIRFSTLRLISEIERKFADDDLWKETISNQNKVESQIVATYEKLIELKTNKTKGEKLSELFSKLPFQKYSPILALSLKNNLSNEQLEERTTRILEFLKSSEEANRTKIDKILKIIQNKPQAVVEAFTEARHKKAQIKYQEEKVIKYEKLYQELKSKIKIGSQILRTYLFSTLQERVSEIKDYDNLYDAEGYDFFGYNHMGYDQFGYDLNNSHVLTLEDWGIDAAGEDYLEGIALNYKHEVDPHSINLDMDESDFDFDFDFDLDLG